MLEAGIDDDVVEEEECKIVVVEDHTVVQEVGIVGALVEWAVFEDNFAVDNMEVVVTFVQSLVFELDGKDSWAYFGGAEFVVVACT